MTAAFFAADADPTWQTPGDLFAQLDAEFDFTLDPCAAGPIKPGIRWFSKTDNGIWQPWAGRVFVNPPYGRSIVDWIRKIHLELERCEVIVALLPVRTDTGWWQDLVDGFAEVRYLRGRLNFQGVGLKSDKRHGSSNAPFASAIAVFR